MASRLSFKANVAAAPPAGASAVAATPTVPCLVIRMGGGKRTFPGGVTKWQWKRLQANKQIMREKAWLLRERRIYEKRKRAEFLASTPVLENPWEVARFPARTPSADVQLSALADRFRKPGAKDLWNIHDGPSVEQQEMPFFGMAAAEVEERRTAEYAEDRSNVEYAEGNGDERQESRRRGPREWEGPRRDLKVPHRAKAKARTGPGQRPSTGPDSHRLWKIEDKNRRGYNHFKF